MLIIEALRAWGDFGASMRRQLELRPGEARLVLYAMFAGVVGFLVSLPSALGQAEVLGRSLALGQTVPREAVFEAQEFSPVAAVLSGRLFGALFLAPLVFYGLAILSHFVAKIVGIRGDLYQSRLAFFWSLVVATPLILLSALPGILGWSDIKEYVQLSVLTGFFWILASMSAVNSAQKQRLLLFLGLLVIMGISIAANLLMNAA